MTDIQAAVGREQLKRLPALLKRRCYLAQRYHELLSRIPGLMVPVAPESTHSNWQSYCVRLPDWCDQREVMQFMLDRKIATRRGIMCAHREPAYENFPPRFLLTESEQAQDRTILLPLYAQMTEGDQARVIIALKEACRRQSDG